MHALDGLVLDVAAGVSCGSKIEYLCHRNAIRALAYIEKTFDILRTFPSIGFLYGYPNRCPNMIIGIKGTLKEP
jgi:hypothetical protein